MQVTRETSARTHGEESDGVLVASISFVLYGGCLWEGEGVHRTNGIVKREGQNGGEGGERVRV